MEDEIESLTKSTEDIEITFDKSQTKRISNVNNLFDSNNPSIKQVRRILFCYNIFNLTFNRISFA
jgi:hypothetical protein